jgi:hypothetical protein
MVKHLGSRRATSLTPVKPLRGLLDEQERGALALLEWLRARRREVDQMIDSTEQHLAYLRRLHRECEQPAAEPGANGHVPLPNGNGSAKLSPLAIPGNRSKKMPPRRAAYAEMTLMEAAGRLLAGMWGRDVRAEYLAEELFELRSTEDHLRAKKAVVSALLRGESKGLWIKRPLPNTFTANKRTMAHFPPRFGLVAQFAEQAGGEP